MDSVTEAAIRETVAIYVMGMTFGDAGQLRALRADYGIFTVIAPKTAILMKRLGSWPNRRP